MQDRPKRLIIGTRLRLRPHLTRYEFKPYSVVLDHVVYNTYVHSRRSILKNIPIQDFLILMSELQYGSPIHQARDDSGQQPNIHGEILFNLQRYYPLVEGKTDISIHYYGVISYINFMLDI